MKLDIDRYAVIESPGAPFKGGVFNDTVSLRKDIENGVFPAGSILMAVRSGRLYRVEITVREIGFDDLQSVQKKRANRMRREAWPSPYTNPPPDDR